MPIMSVLSAWSSVACGSDSGIFFWFLSAPFLRGPSVFIGLLSKRTGMAIINTLPNRIPAKSNDFPFPL